MSSIYGDIAYLIAITKTKNGVGDMIPTKTERMVYVDEKSIRQSEFYQSQQTGLRPEVMLEMRRIDYEAENYVKYDGKELRILRTYRKGKDFIELICGGLVSEVI